MSSLADIVSLLQEASRAYYSGSQLTMDDDTYDGIVERLRELDPTHEYLLESGSPPPDSFAKEILCISGEINTELKQKLAKKGLTYTRILSASVTVLIISTVPNEQEEEQKAKIRVAREFGMKILTQSQFIQQYLS